MVPKINRFDFYTYETIGGKLIQLVGENTDTTIPSYLSKEEISIIVDRVRFCNLLSRIEFDIDSYGMINYLAQNLNHLSDLKELSQFMIKYNYIDGSTYILNSFKFKEDNLETLKALSTASDQDQQMSNLNRLKELKDFSDIPIYDCSLRLDSEIRAEPNKFCVGLDGNPLDPSYTGNIKSFHPDGKLKAEYSIVNGRANGECLFYNFNGEKYELKLFKNGKFVVCLKRWTSKGKLTFENVNYYKNTNNDLTNKNKLATESPLSFHQYQPKVGSSIFWKNNVIQTEPAKEIWIKDRDKKIPYIFNCPNCKKSEVDISKLQFKATHEIAFYFPNSTVNHFDQFNHRLFQCKNCSTVFLMEKIWKEVNNGRMVTAIKWIYEVTLK